MKIQLGCIMMIALVASPLSHADGCSLPERGLVLASLTSVAAPEMFAPGAQEQACLSVQQLIAATPATTPAVVDGSGYVPKTQYDNTPWRFNMNQNGKRMTVEEFDAWMKAKGIHVATGKPGTNTVSDGGACVPSASVSC